MKDCLCASAALAAGLGLMVSNAAIAGVESFDSQVAGFVVAGDLPSGGTADGMAFDGFTVSVVNTGGGPQSCIVFDSSNPTGEDSDLGTPNETCPGGGPGQGSGGEVGQEGENCEALGNILIVAEDIEDTDNDDIVDDPDDESGGGAITFLFDELVIMERVVILDIDSETAEVVLSDANKLMVMVNASDLGDNSAQTLDLAGFGPVNEVEVVFSSSGAVGEIEFREPPVPVLESSWGQIKANFPR